MDKTTVIAAAVAGVLTTGVVGAAMLSSGPEAAESVQEAQIQEMERPEEAVPEIHETEEQAEPLLEDLAEEKVQESERETNDELIEAMEEDSVPEASAATPKSEPKPIAPTPKQEPPPAAPACSCPSSDLDCKDFSSGPAAQSVYQCCLSQGRGDYHDLDRDQDGTACDSLW